MARCSRKRRTTKGPSRLRPASPQPGCMVYGKRQDGRKPTLPKRSDSRCATRRAKRQSVSIQLPPRGTRAAAAAEASAIAIAFSTASTSTLRPYRPEIGNASRAQRPANATTAHRGSWLISSFEGKCSLIRSDGIALKSFCCSSHDFSPQVLRLVPGESSEPIHTAIGHFRSLPGANDAETLLVVSYRPPHLFV